MSDGMKKLVAAATAGGALGLGLGLLAGLLLPGSGDPLYVAFGVAIGTGVGTALAPPGRRD